MKGFFPIFGFKSVQMNRLVFVVAVSLWTMNAVSAQDLPLLQISKDQHYLVTGNETPFFWLGGTAWEMIHRLEKEEIDTYLTDRAKKGFTVIQTVILAEFDGVRTPNAYGHLPLIDQDPAQLNETYFELVDYVVHKAASLGLYVGLLPTWGDKFNRRWGEGPEIFTPENAAVYGELLARRYLGENNIVWILGGDRVPEKEDHFEIIRAMAEGIRKADDRHLVTYHPVGGRRATEFFNEPWLDVDMFQSGHNHEAKEYQYVSGSRMTEPARPVINGESRYENIPDRFWEDVERDWLDAADVRVSAWWSMLAGAAGYTYGCNDIWQMYETGREPTIQARTGWEAALRLPGSEQMGFMRKLFEMVDWQQLQPDQSLILGENPEDASHIRAAIRKDAGCILAYTPVGKNFTLDLARVSAPEVFGYWFNPRSGKFTGIGKINTAGPREFSPWARGWGSDFLLVLSATELASNPHTDE